VKVQCATLGCKLNYYESCALAEEMTNRGFQVVRKGPADIVIVNTCAVTSRAGMQSRQEVRKALKKNPEALVIMTGCYAQGNPDAAGSIPGLAAVVGNAGKAVIPRWLDEHYAADPAVGKRQPEAFGFDGSLPVEALKTRNFMGRARAFLKIQDGCNAFCHYCIIPFLRGRSRSLNGSEIIAEARAIAAAGYRELVLTGVHIGQYGLDLEPSRDLDSLLRELLRETGFRLRLGSLQPREITPLMIEMLADEKNNLCEHLHLSLQSADDMVLASMGRSYGRKEIISLVEAVKDANPRITLGADIIVGYPTETEAAFNNTRRLLADLPVTYLHVFPYSPRPGTRAAKMKDEVPSKVKKERVKILQEIGREKKRLTYRQYIGRPLDVIIERARPSGKMKGLLSGHSRNYLQVLIAGEMNGGPDAFLNRELRVVPHDGDGDGLVARIDSVLQL
jgi:threonylcarbamoyladenosine tRNA methylthiotransferase MtaB